MLHVDRPIPFVLIASDHGAMIINRNDYRMVDAHQGYGIGYQLLKSSSMDSQEISLTLRLLERRKRYFQSGVVALDCGANIGAYTIEWARLMHGWGEVLAFEAQEKIYYALAGNIALNNCLNATARWAAVGSRCGSLEIPEPNYLIPSSYGSLELKESDKNEFIGQKIDYKKTKNVPLVSIDSLELKRLDLIKIDVEGMELEVLEGAKNSIARYAPLLFIEIIKSDKTLLEEFLLKNGYKFFQMGMNVLAVHREDPVLSSLHVTSGTLHFT